MYTSYATYFKQEIKIKFDIDFNTYLLNFVIPFSYYISKGFFVSYTFDVNIIIEYPIET
jgi:hypothetical protein